MATVAELEDALRNAHKAGDTNAARKLADALVSARQSAPGSGIDPAQGTQVIPGLDPVQPEASTPDPSVAAIEAEAGAQPRTLGGQLARDVPRTARGMAQGASLGFSDEALAGVRSLAGESYGEALADERAELNKLGPARLPAEIVGGLPLGLAAGGRAAAAKTLGGRMAQGAGVGGGFGGVYGFGTGEGGFGNRLENAALPAAAGATLGAAAPAAIAGVGRGARFVGERAVPFLQRQFGGKEGAAAAQGTVRDQAARRVAQTILEQYPDMPPQQAIRNAQRVVQRYGPKAALMDAGELTRELAKATVRQGGAPGMQIEKFARQRQEGTLAPSGQVRGGQYERVSNILDDVDDTRLRAMQDKLYSERSAAGREAFDKALDTGPIYSDRLKQFTDDPVMRGGFARGLELERLDALANNRPFDPYKYGVTGFDEAGDPILGKVPTMRTYQAMKEGLGAQIADEMDQFGRLSKRGVALQKVLDKYLEELDAFNPAYAAARKAWAGPSQRLNASREGFRFMSKAEFANPDEMAARLSRMSEPEKEAFRVGAVQALKDKAGEIGATSDIVSRLWNKGNLRNRLRLAFGDAKTFRKAVRGLMGEKEMFKTYSALTRGSDTAKNIASMQRASQETGSLASDALGATADVATGGKFGLLRMASRALKPRGILGPPEPVRGEMAGILTNQSIDDLLRAAEIASGGTLNRRALEQALLASQASGGTRGLLQ